MTTYIISDLSQLRYVPKNKDGAEIVLETVRNIKKHNNDIFSIIHIKLNNAYIVSLLYNISTEKNDYDLYVYNIEEIVDILNKNGFSIVYQQHIQLNENEETILTSVYNLGYGYIQCGRYGAQEDPLQIYISVNPINAYSANQEFVNLYSLCPYGNEDFVWLREEPYNSLSIPLLLNRQYPEPL